MTYLRFAYNTDLHEGTFCSCVKTGDIFLIIHIKNGYSLDIWQK